MTETAPILTTAHVERLAELLGCDPDFGTIAAEITLRNREQDRMRKTIGELRAEVNRRSDQGCASGHVILEAGVEPGISYPCRCEECRDVATRMADAGYLDGVEDRWWESHPVGVEGPGQGGGQL